MGALQLSDVLCVEEIQEVWASGGAGGRMTGT